MTVQLEIRTPTGRRHTVTLEGDLVDVGRAAECAIRLPFPAISSRHSRLTRVGAAWMIEDLDSRNGTVVDGRALALGERVTLSDGAQIELGGVTLEVIDVGDSTGAGFSLSESGTMLRQLVAEAVAAEGGASLKSHDGRVVDVPDFAAQLVVDAFEIDRRGHGFWLTPRGQVLVAGVAAPAEGVALRDGVEVRGERTWVFHDPLEAALARVDQPRADVSGGAGGAARRVDRALIWLGGGAVLFSAAALLVLFEVL